MAFQQVPNTAQITVRYTSDSFSMANTYHAEAPAGYTASDLATLAAQIDLNAAAGMLADQSLYCHYVETEVRGLHSEYDTVALNSTSAGVGGVVDQMMPVKIAFAIQRYSGQTGRSARGRVYVTGIPVSYIDIGEANRNYLKVSAADAYLGHVEGFRTVIEAIGPWNAVIVSRYHNGSKRATGITFPWIGSKYSDRLLDVLRSRGR